MDQCEGVAVDAGGEKPAASKDEKASKKLLISLFFDGTLNNRSNIEVREKFEKGGDGNTFAKEGNSDSNSYDNGRTNIALMEHQVVLDPPCGFAEHFCIYTEGQGTFNEEGDSTAGYAFGAFASGVYQRARQGINKAMEELEDWKSKNSPTETKIEKIEINVFGFSRGAATARHCIYVLLKDAVPFFQRVKNLGYEELTEQQVEVVFAGLFDTVVSVNASQYLPEACSDDKLNQTAVAFAKKSLHLAAAEEHRVDFPLHRIRSAVVAGTGKEVYLPGVHSDVGGSYNLATVDQYISELRIKLAQGSKSKMEKLKAALTGKTPGSNAESLDIKSKKTMYAEDELEVVAVKTDKWFFSTKHMLIRKQPVNGSELMRETSELKIINSAEVTQLEKDKAKLIKLGWYTEDEIAITDEWVFGADPETGEGGVLCGDLFVNRRSIKSGYSNIPLKIMAKAATKETEKRLKFKQELEKLANDVIQRCNLGDVDGKLISYADSAGNATSKPDDWFGTSAKEIDLTKLRHDHLHMSCKMSIGYKPNITVTKGMPTRARDYYNG